MNYIEYENLNETEKQIANIETAIAWLEEDQQEASNFWEALEIESKRLLLIDRANELKKRT